MKYIPTWKDTPKKFDRRMRQAMRDAKRNATPVVEESIPVEEKTPPLTPSFKGDSCDC